MTLKASVVVGSLLLLCNAKSGYCCDVDNPPRLVGQLPAVISPGDTLKLSVANGYLAGAPLLVRVELLNSRGERDWSVWDTDAILSMDGPALPSTNTVKLHNGLGSALLTFSGTVDFNLTASVDTLHATRPLKSLAASPQTFIGGTLPPETNVWSGVMHVTNDVTVPTGSTLIIQSNTLVLIDGVVSGTVANDILVSGAIFSQGTEDNPVTITCASAGLNWGQIRHNTAQPSSYSYTTVIRGGRGVGEGHTGTASLIRPTASRITFQSCNLGDVTAAGATIGKIMQTFSGADITFDNCLMTRARSGPEIDGTTLMLTNSYIIDMNGPDDADGIYLHSGGPMRITHCVIAGGDDDAIDTLGAVMTIDNCIIRNFCDKGVSVLDGAINMDKDLVVDDTHGVSAKSQSANTVIPVNINRSTIAVATNGIAVINKSGPSGVRGVYRVTNTVIRAYYSVVTDYSPTNYYLGYCNLNASFSGQGNTQVNNDALGAVVLSGVGIKTNSPMFLDQNSDNYGLQSYSPCIDAGDPTSPNDPDGSPIDVGYFTFVPNAPVLTNSTVLPDGAFQLALNAYSNRNYVVEFSDNLPTLVWNQLQTIWQTNEVSDVTDRTPAKPENRFYRARLAP